jgi:hypothetical protein
LKTEAKLNLAVETKTKVNFKVKCKTKYTVGQGYRQKFFSFILNINIKKKLNKSKAKERG